MSKIHKSYDVFLDSQNFILINRFVENDNSDLDRQLSDNMNSSTGQLFDVPDVNTAELTAKAVVEKKIAEALRLEAEAAKKEAEELKQEAINLLEESKRQAEIIMEESREAGYSKGFSEGKTEFVEKYSSFLRQLEDLLDQVRQEREKVIDNMENDIVDLSFTIAESVLKYELDRDSKAYESIIQNAINAVKETDRSMLRIHPDGEFAASQIKKNPPFEMEWVRDMEIVTDPYLKKGDCIMDTSIGSVDTGIATQLEQIRKSFNDLLQTTAGE